MEDADVQQKYVQLNPDTGAGSVDVPEMPGKGGSYAQMLEWAALLALRNEVRRTGARADVAEMHIRACVEYEKRWRGKEAGHRDVSVTQVPSTS